MNELTQKYLELHAIAYERTQELEHIKLEIEKMKVLIEYQKQIDQQKVDEGIKNDEPSKNDSDSN